MVATVHVPSSGSLAAADAGALAAWIDHVAAAYAPAERAAIGKALDSARVRYTGLRTADGEPWLDRALGTASIVATLKLDADSVRAAGPLRRAEDAHVIDTGQLSIAATLERALALCAAAGL